ncbi:MAG: lysophospholipid acyltransferase family protein [Bacteroidales bacterium]|nr:lysophospholipid acyltransferase family protein [Bacteroidales bacterium]
MAHLPLGFHRLCGGALGKVVRNVVKYRRETVKKNLQMCFPDRDEEFIGAVDREYYRHLGTLISEAVWFGSATNRGRLARSGIVEIRNAALPNSYYDCGRSVMVLGSHCGNFEIIGGLQVYGEASEALKYPESGISVVYKRLSSPVWERFLRRNRTAPILDKEHYDGMVESRDALRYVLRRRDDRCMYIFITDQYPYSSAGLDVDFMGLPSKTMSGGVAIARKLHLPVVYMGMGRRPDDRGYAIEFKPLCDDASLTDESALMQKYYRLLEEDIRKQPWNYLWSHRRWKNL